jgi:hypothetical protein
MIYPYFLKQICPTFYVVRTNLCLHAGNIKFNTKKEEVCVKLYVRFYSSIFVCIICKTVALITIGKIYLNTAIHNMGRVLQFLAHF